MDIYVYDLCIRFIVNTYCHNKTKQKVTVRLRIDSTSYYKRKETIWQRT